MCSGDASRGAPAGCAPDTLPVESSCRGGRVQNASPRSGHSTALLPPLAALRFAAAGFLAGAEGGAGVGVGSESTGVAISAPNDPRSRSFSAFNAASWAARRFARRTLSAAAAAGAASSTAPAAGRKTPPVGRRLLRPRPHRAPAACGVGRTRAECSSILLVSATQRGGGTVGYQGASPSHYSGARERAHVRWLAAVAGGSKAVRTQCLWRGPLCHRVRSCARRALFGSALPFVSKCLARRSARNHAVCLVWSGRDIACACWHKGTKHVRVSTG